MRSRRTVSCYDASRMPEGAIRKRELHSFSVHYSMASFSVHYSMATAKWVATLVRPSNTNDSSSGSAVGGPGRCASFSFTSEREARNFAKCYSPPKMVQGATTCLICSAAFGRKLRSCNCRNCGSAICDKCSCRWGIKMVPRTFLPSISSLTVRVCKSCDWLTNAFCMALLQGNYANAVKLHEAGNINLRNSFADINKEAMFPVHCAVMGGNLKIVQWLIEVQGCPYSIRRDPKTRTLQSVQTSANRTLIDLAMTGKPKIDILGYLVKKNLSVLDTKDPNLAPKTLQILMRAGFRFELVEGGEDISSVQSSEMCESSVVTTVEDVCVLCCEKQMDCVLTPCGHQICCSGCGSNLSKCPICKNPCKMLRIYRL